MKINYTRDILLRGPDWAYCIDNLVGTMFDTQWDLYSLCISIGMMYDEQVESDDLVPDDYDFEPRYVPRNMLTHSNHAALIEFMVQSALITTKHLDMSEDDRLQLAFDDNAEPDFNVMAFLTKFANAGMLRVKDLISEVDPTETMEAMATFLTTSYEKGVDNVDDLIEIEDEESY